MSIQIDGNGFIRGYGPLMLRNKLLNPTFIFNHRAVLTTLTAGQYSMDRWKGGSSGCTYSIAQSGNVRQTTITAGTLQQVVESWHLEGGTYCLSWQGTAQARVNGGAYSTSGMTFTLPAFTDATIEFNAGTVLQPQLELGTLPSVFEFRFIGLERAMLQRYFFTTVVAPALTVHKLTTGAAYGGSAPQTMLFPQSMRIIPAVTIYSDSSRGNPGNVMKNGSTVTTIANGVVTEVTSTGFKYWAPGAFASAGDYANFFCDFDAEI